MQTHLITLGRLGSFPLGLCAAGVVAPIRVIVLFLLLGSAAKHGEYGRGDDGFGVVGGRSGG